MDYTEQYELKVNSGAQEEMQEKNMFLGHSLLSYASIINFLNSVAPPEPRDPPGVFDKPLEQYYDYIVVGSGSAGGIIATRLTEDPAVSVLLLEAGGSDLENEQTQIPLTAGNLLRSKYDWNFKTVPQKHSHKALNNRENYYPRGKMLGGSSSINGMLYMRGSRHDYDEWERQGCKGWGYSGVLPYFKKMENVTVPGLKDSRVKRTNTSDTSVLNDSGSKKPSRKKSKKKNKSKSTEDNSCVNTGDSSGDITNVNKPPNTPSNSNVLDTMNTSVNMSQQNFSQDPNFVYTYNPGPNAGFMPQNPHLCSSPTLGMYPPPMHHMQHISPPTQSASTQQRPTWVDEIFRRMDQFENKLDKLEKIDSFVTSLNAKVIRLEKVPNP
ncbi:Hypothetical predicted protein [Mytilus galloprovincialis]|uniref:Glucose-methanol-choline oxidoreductase N-terminal domain-containing protein n=1 Tax=Mytilus galloprovincialis TaxID=29158 RepID=A0A8B6GEY0_MYTGA|nr:Hypothetical predicted protein [Mytilus galloprovincialis]